MFSSGSKVLLVNIPSTWAGKRRPIFPTGICFIGDHLDRRWGCAVRILDLNVEEQPRESLKSLVSSWRPQIVGLSLRNAFFQDEPQLENATRTVRMVRSEVPEALLIGGGPGFSLHAPGFLNALPELDAICFGEGERTLDLMFHHQGLEVPGVWIRKEGAPHYLPGLTFLPPEEIHQPDLNATGLRLVCYNQIGVQTKRGCPHHCKYCSEHAMAGSSMRLLCGEEVCFMLDSIAAAGQKEVFIVDGTFDQPLSHSVWLLEQFAARYSRRLQFFLQVRIEQLTEEYVHLLERANVVLIYVSLESGSARLQESLGVPTTQQEFKRMRPWLGSRKQLKIRYTYLVGLPGETFLDLLLTFAHMFQVLVRSGFRDLPFLGPLHIKPYSEFVSLMEEDPAGEVRNYRLYRSGWRWFFPVMRFVSRVSDRLGWLWLSATRG